MFERLHAGLVNRLSGIGKTIKRNKFGQTVQKGRVLDENYLSIS